MNVERYILVQAVKTADHELIPIWDERIKFNKTEDCGNQLTFGDGYHDKSHDTIECIYDLKTRKLSMGIELDFYPTDTKNGKEYSEGQSVYVELDGRKLKEAKIEKIVFEEFEVSIYKGKKIEGYWKTYFKDVVFENEKLYAIKRWKPFYILDNGKKIEWSHQLYDKAE